MLLLMKEAGKGKQNMKSNKYIFKKIILFLPLLKKIFFDQFFFSGQ
jgi:hypothetical protein